MIFTGIFHNLLLTIAAVFAIFAGGCSDSASPLPPDPPPPPPPDTTITRYTYNIVNTYPHDENAFTQGLVYADSSIIEGTGYHLGPSTLRRVEIETGAVIKIRDMSGPWFGEGVAVWGDSIVQLTWVSNVAVVYDSTTFDEIGQFHYDTEGWGLTHDGARFIMSTGTDTLYFRDRNTFAEIGRIEVKDNNGPVGRLNELEYINGHIWANRYQTTWIIMIDPATGRVKGEIDLGTLGDQHRGVANGIAYDAANDRLFVTGKLWRHLYEIDLIPLE